MMDSSKKSEQTVQVTEHHCSFDDKNVLVSAFDKLLFDELVRSLHFINDLLEERNEK